MPEKSLTTCRASILIFKSCSILLFKLILKIEQQEERKEDEPMDEDASEDQAKSTDSKKVSSAKNAVDEMDVEVGGMDEKTWSEVSFY